MNLRWTRIAHTATAFSNDVRRVNKIKLKLRLIRGRGGGRGDYVKMKARVDDI